MPSRPIRPGTPMPIASTISPRNPATSLSTEISESRRSQKAFRPSSIRLSQRRRSNMSPFRSTRAQRRFVPPTSIPIKRCCMSDSILFCKCSRQTLKGLRQPDGYYPYVSDNRHEIGITVPAWHDMNMQVIFHPRPGRLAQIDAHIEAVGAGNLFQKYMPPAKKVHQIQQLGVGQVAQFRRMPQRRPPQMTSGIGITIEHHQGMVAPDQDQALPVVFSRMFRAEDTTFF